MYYDGGAIVAQSGRISIHGSTLFQDNTAHHGGAMVLRDVHLEIIGNISLDNNSATYDGGALHIMSNTEILFKQITML